MAVRKRTRPAKEETGDFLILRSECGDYDQVEYVDCSHTAEGAKATAETDAENRSSNGESGCTYYVVRVVKEATPAGLNWK